MSKLNLYTREKLLLLSTKAYCSGHGDNNQDGDTKTSRQSAKKGKEVTMSLQRRDKRKPLRFKKQHHP